MTSQGHGRDIVAVMTWKAHKRKGRYGITELDRDMLVRASAHEGAPHAEVVRVLLQRFAWLYPKYYERMEDFVQSYVQPINPKWFPDGKLQLRELARLRRKGQEAMARDQERRAERRVGYASQLVPHVEGRYHTYVDRVLEDTADWSHITGAIHYRAARGYDNVEGESLALDFAEDRDGWFSIDAGHGFKAGTTWFFGVGKSKSLELTTELIREPDEKRDSGKQQEPEEQGVSHNTPLNEISSSGLADMAGSIADILADRADYHGDC